MKTPTKEILAATALACLVIFFVWQFVNFLSR